MNLKVVAEITLRMKTDEFALNQLRDKMREQITEGKFMFNDAKIRVDYRDEEGEKE